MTLNRSDYSDPLWHAVVTTSKTKSLLGQSLWSEPVLGVTSELCEVI
uniref:Uncharacterized protein n=1 Tax=Anguilla anguilla TaxID=7936 RepID=A0A0E9PZA1_ANGAN